MILRAGLFAPLVPRALRLEAARGVGRTADVALLCEMARRFPEGVPYALRLWPEENRAELFLHPVLHPHLEPFLEREPWRVAMAYAGVSAAEAAHYRERFPPSDRPALALLSALASSWSQVEGDQLSEALGLCQHAVRLRVLHTLPASGRPELVRAVAVSGIDWLALEPDEWQSRLSALVRSGPDEAFGLLPSLRPEQALFAVETLAAAAWTPPAGLRAAWEQLQSARLPSWRVLDAQVRAPFVAGRNLAQGGLVLSPAGRWMAWPGSLGRIGLDYEEVAALPGLAGMEFSPTGAMLAGLHQGVAFLGLDTPSRPVLLYRAPDDSAFALSRTRPCTCGEHTLSVWPGPDSIALPSPAVDFAALDPPGAVILFLDGRLGAFWAGGRELRFSQERHLEASRVVAREGRRRYAATFGRSGVQLWRLLQLFAAATVHPVGERLPSATHVAFWRDFLVCDSCLYSLETAELVADLGGEVTSLFVVGDVLVHGLSDGSLRFWDGSRESLVPGVGAVSAVAPDPTGYWLLAGQEIVQLTFHARVRALREMESELPAVAALLQFTKAYEVEVGDMGPIGLTDIEVE